MLRDYQISSIRKPGATTMNVLSYCHTLSKNLTNNDNIIILSGSNDLNPMKFLIEMSAALKELKNCNVL